MLSHSKLLLATNPPDIVINEVAWMGTAASTYDEWIELYNTTDQDIDLTGWTLEAADGTPSITFPTPQGCSNLIIPAKGFFLLERTNNDTISDIPADCIYTGALGNGGEALFLKDSAGNVIDTANGNGGAWPAGINPTDDPVNWGTMERIDPLEPDSDANWTTNDGIHRNGLDANGNPINGTPKNRNSATNIPPTADANGPYSCTRLQSVTINGSGSTDPDGNIVSWEWDIDGHSASGEIVDFDCSGLAPGDYTVILTVTDNDGASSDPPDTTTLTVTNIPPTVTLLQPNGGEFWAGTQEITWNASDPDDDNALKIDIRYSNDGGSTWHIIATDEDNDGSYSWDTTTVSDGSNYLIKVIAKDPHGATDEDTSDSSFTIDATSPAVTVIAPNGGEQLGGGYTFQIEWEATDTNMADFPIMIEYSTDNGAHWIQIAEDEPNDGEFDWLVPKIRTSTGLIKVTVEDRAGNIGGDTSDENFAIVIVQKGDVNGDGVIDINDAKLTAEFSIGLEAPEPWQESAADVAPPCGTIDMRDAVRIAEVALGIEGPGICGCAGRAALGRAGGATAEKPIARAVKITMEDKEMAPGEVGTIYISSDQGLAGIQVGPHYSLSFDPGVIKVTTIRGVPPYQVLAHEIDNGAGKAEFMAIALGEPGGGGIIEIEVEAIGQEGDSTMVKLTPDMVIDAEGNELATETAEGRVLLGRAMPLRVDHVLSIPNPVRSGDSVRFIVEGQGIEDIQVEIFDLSGRGVFSSGWVDGETFEWHLMNSQGEALANGVYLYMVRVRGFDDRIITSRVMKLVILR